ncbi:MAG: hypothetical protein V7749_03590 [Cocleimonas sp.]
MTYFIYQITLLSTIAVLAGIGIGWWLHFYYGQSKRVQPSKDLDALKGYLAESVKTNAHLKIKLKHAEEQIETLTQEEIPGLGGVDFEAYKAFENTIKEANLRKYLS